MPDRDEIAFSAKPETFDELLRLVPEARSRQEAILICISAELERRRAAREE